MISVVIETFTLAHEYPSMTLAESPLAEVIAALAAQSRPPHEIEVIVVVDESNDCLAASLAGGRYFSMKNHGLGPARGEVVAFLDGDCVPCPDWGAEVLGALDGGADVVAGRTRYAPKSPLAHLLGLFDFGFVQTERDGNANSFIANNVAFRRSVLSQHRFDDRVARSGGEYLLACRLKALGYRVVYRPGMVATHDWDNVGLGFVVKRLRAGYDAINVCRLDEGAVIRETLLLRLGWLAPLGLFASRVWFDVKRFFRNRRDLDIPLSRVPIFWLASPLLRGIEMVAAAMTLLRPSYFPRKFGW